MTNIDFYPYFTGLGYDLENIGRLLPGSQFGQPDVAVDRLLKMLNELEQALEGDKELAGHPLIGWAIERSRFVLNKLEDHLANREHLETEMIEVFHEYLDIKMRFLERVLVRGEWN